MRLYYWPTSDDRRTELGRPRVECDERLDRGAGSARVHLSAFPPYATDRYATVDIPRRVAEPYRVATGRYRMPASVVRAYQARPAPPEPGVDE